ncbi:alpha/beta hydrolase [Thiohalospira sp.]|uniref:alpha/beta hydrolase n=1 Tax=Thiohalospira sp. TaxID=3080549 RepID=UPI00398164A3
MTAITEPAPAVVVEPAETATAAVIWFHGLGANGHDFEPVAGELGLPSTVRFVFPHAPARPVTVNGGMAMPAWHDIRSADLTGDVDREGIAASVETARAFIAAERRRGIPAGRIILAGFSQGGVVALHAGVGAEEPLGGIVALSTFFPDAEATLARAPAATRATPVFLAHGEEDTLVLPEYGRATAQALEARGHPLTTRTYAMGHAVCPEEIADIGRWLRERLA